MLKIQDELPDGSTPVTKFWNKNLTEDEVRICERKLETLEQLGLQIFIENKTREIEKLGRYSQYYLYEFKVHYKRQIRIFLRIKDQLCFLVHTYIKKDKRLREEEIKTALQRIKRNF